MRYGMGVVFDAMTKDLDNCLSPPLLIRVVNLRRAMMLPPKACSKLLKVTEVTGETKETQEPCKALRWDNVYAH